MHPHLFLPGLLIVAACGRGSPATAAYSHTKVVSVDRDFSLAVGEAARVANTPITIGFAKVEDDSRCDPNVTCVWAGNGRVGLEVTGEGQKEALVLNTTLNPQSRSVHGFMLRLMDLNRRRPSATADSVGYKVTLRVSREAP
ncbi:MAG: hypothetical protein ABI679_03585 [Gemmatimonadota bacterium]